MLVSYNYNKSNDEALAKAQQLTTNLSQAGLPTPRDPASVARVFGTDGGAVCASVDNGVALGIAKFNLSVGSEFYRRAVVADHRVAAGLLAVVKTYCPDKVPTLQHPGGLRVQAGAGRIADGAAVLPPRRPASVG